SDLVVHLAAIAHAGPEIAEQAYDRVNRLATAELAGAAKIMGIKHLVFMSSLRAQGGPASDGFRSESDCHPTDFGASPTRHVRPTFMDAPSLPPRTRCAPRVCRSRSCVRC